MTGQSVRGAENRCRHYQLVDGWAKVWCVRTEFGHTEHETAAGFRWTSEVDYTNGAS